MHRNRTRAPWRRCSSCHGVCHWHDEAWVCRDCGDEWFPEHGRRFAAPVERKLIGHYPNCDIVLNKPCSCGGHWR